MPKDINCKVEISRYESRGIFKRIYNIAEAAFKQGDINHITGDVNYLCYFMRRKHTILTVHDCNFTFNATGFKKCLLWFFWFVIPFKRVACVTVISESTKQELLKYVRYSEGKIHVVPNCISPVFKYTPQAFNVTRPLILQIGTKVNKNILRLADALRDIPCKLEIIGNLTEKQKQSLVVNSIDYTNCTGITEDEMVKKYQSCDMLTFVSLYEGFGMPILEANAIGRPVITSNILSMPEVAGDAACLVDPYNIEDIRTGILRIIGDRQYREQLVINGLKNVGRYAPEIIAKQYAGLYREVYDAR